MQLSILGIDDLAFATGVSGILGGIGSIFGSSSANDTQKDIAAENRQWQTEENQINRDWQANQNLLSQQWQEKMWNAQNQYNTPSAQMQRNLAAGYNPFYLGQSGADSLAGSVGTPAKGSPSMVGSPSMPNIQPVNYGAPFSSLASTLLQAKGVDANAANQKAQSVKSIVEAATQAFKSMGYKGFNAVLQYAAPFLGDSSPDGSYVEREAFYYLQRMQLDNAEKDIAVSLKGKYSEQQIQTGLEKANYEISEIVSRLNTMRITNEVTLKKLANDTLVAFAQAFNLRKQGEKYVADAATINAIRPYVKSLMSSQSSMAANEAELSRLRQSGEKALIPMRQGSEFNTLDVKGNKNLIFLDYVTDQIGDVFHFGAGYYNSSGTYNYGQLPFMQAEWDVPNPLGTTTHYKKRVNTK